MRKYQIYALLQFDSGSSGNAAAGVEFNVYNAGGGLATIYAQNGASPISQASPLVTDLNGRYEFYAENGRYSILFTDETIASQNDLTDVSIYEYGSAGARDVATTAEAIAGVSDKLPNTSGVHAVLDEYGIGKGFPPTIVDYNKMGLLGSGFYRDLGGSLNAPLGVIQSAVINIKRAGSGTEDEIDGGQLIIGTKPNGIRVAGFRFAWDTAYSNIPFVELYHTENLIHAQNVSGTTRGSNATISGANLNPAKTGTWRNVSGNDIFNTGYGLWERV